MAAVTRFFDLQEFQNKLDQFQQMETMKRAASELKIQKQFAGMDRKFEHIINTLAELQLRLLQMVLISTAGNDFVLGVYGSAPRSGNNSGFVQNYVHTSLPRINFPRFDGSNPRAWILQCNNYFKLMPSILDAQRINLATLHFDGKALTWIQSLNMVEIRITWKQFLEVVCARFEVVPISSMILEFNKLKHHGNYEEYVEQFEELRTYVMLNVSSKYSEDYFVAKFLSGLSEELQAFINMFQPTNLEQTIELGRKQIHTFDAISKRISSDASSVQIQFPTHKRIDAISPQISSRLSIITSTNPTTKTLTTAGMKTEEEILDAPEDMKLGIPEVESNLVQAVKEVHKFWKLLNAQEVANFKHPDTGKEICAILRQNQRPRQWHEKNINMIFTTFRNGKKVKFKSLTTVVDNISTTELVFSSLTHEDITYFNGLFIEEHEAVHAKSALMLGFLPGRYSDSFQDEYSDESNVFFPQHITALVHLNMALSVRNPTLSSYENAERKFIRSIGTKIIPVFMYLEHDVAGASLLGTDFTTGRVNKVLQGFADRIQLWLVFVATHPPIAGPMAKLYACFSHCLSVLSLYSTQEYKEFQFFLQRMGIPEIHRDDNFKIESLLVLGTVLTKKVENFAQILLLWLTVRPEFARKVENCLCHKFLSLDPRGRGSSAAGGIVMDCERVTKKEEEEKLEKWSRVPIWGRCVLAKMCWRRS